MNKIMNKQLGFTLVELLVALFIGLLLTAAVITIFASSQSTFRASQGVSRSQEATRFAMHFLKTDIRQAGYSGCSAGVSQRSTLDQLNDDFIPAYEDGIFGWDFEDTNTGQTFDLNYTSLTSDATNQDIADASADNTEPRTMWTGQTIQGAGAVVTNQAVNLPPVIQALSPLRGSDIVAVTLAERLLFDSDGDDVVDSPVYIARQIPIMTPTLQTVDVDGNAVETGVGTGGIVTVGDCSSTDTFQNTAGSGDSFFSATPNNAVSPDNIINGVFSWQKQWDESAQIFQQTTRVYFVGTGASGSPSLYRYSSNCGLVDPTAAAGDCQVTLVELVEGVENMQAKYAEDFDGDNVPDSILSADQVTDFNNVLSVDLGLLLRSVDNGLDINNTSNYVLAGNTTINPPDDRFQRFVSNTSIRLHNRGL